MKTSFINQLLCPHCGEALAAAMQYPPEGEEIEHGILTCGCREYPVVAGIPILKGEGRVDVMDQTVDCISTIGPKLKDLISLIRGGFYEKALLLLLVMPNRRTTRLISLTESVPIRVKAGVQALADRSWLRQQNKSRELLMDARAGTTAFDMFDFFYNSSTRSEVYNYWTCRFAQPRHLAGLALASLLPVSKKPILDLACGFGHLMHYWLRSHPGQQVVGVDRNFFQLYVAKKWVAPGGEFVCSDADVKLPFPSGSFCGVFCSDAFHYFLRRLQCAEEMKRLVEAGGLIILSRFGNSQVEPREGYELTASGYLKLFAGLHTRMMSEEDLLQGYLGQLGPQLEKESDPANLAKHKWLCLVASENQARFRNYGKFEDWPHGAGRLKLNPLYHERERDALGNVTLDFRFPSAWYEFENSGCLRYMPKRVTLAAEIINAMHSGARSAEVESLVQQCVLVGMPERYC